MTAPGDSTVKMDPATRVTVTKALAGDPAAFEALIRRYAGLVYAQVFMLLRDHHDCEDVVQETFLKAYTFRIRLRDPRKFPHWLLSIARNTARDVLRLRQKRDTAVADSRFARAARPAAAGPAVQAQLAERHRQVVAALAGLPEHWRLAVTLRYLDGWRHQRIREKMGISDGALRGILGRALRGLRRRLRDDRKGDSRAGPGLGGKEAGSS